MQPSSPILVRVVGPATDELTLGDVILGALILGIVLGGLFILYRRRHPNNHFNGESSDELSLHLDDRPVLVTRNP